MKLTQREKNRISQLHSNGLNKESLRLNEFFSRVKELLSEQNSKVPPLQGSGTYQWGSSTPPQVVNTDAYGARYTIPSTTIQMNPEAIKKLKEQNDKIRNILGWVSFVTGLIPHPITIGISVAADLAIAQTYSSEGDYYNAGLYGILAITSFGIGELTGVALKRLKETRNVKQLEKLAEKLKMGDKGLNTLTKTEMRLLDEISNSNNLQKIYNGFDDYTKQVAEQYLSDPSKFKNGYKVENFLSENGFIPGSNIYQSFEHLYYNDLRKRRLAPFKNFLLGATPQVISDIAVEDFLFPYIAPSLGLTKTLDAKKELNTTSEKNVDDMTGDELLNDIIPKYRLTKNDGLYFTNNKFIEDLEVTKEIDGIQHNLYIVLKDFKHANQNFVKDEIVAVKN